MAKGGVTKKLEDTLTALDRKELKKALYLTEHPKLERQHQFVEEAARTCLVNKDNKEACEQAIREARTRVHDTVSLPLDDTSLEGLEQYLTPPEERKAEPMEVSPAPEQQSPQAEQTDEELYEGCEECHVAVAAARIADICAENPEEAGSGCALIERNLEDQNTLPEDWLKGMIQATEGAQGKAKDEMAAAVTELTDYLEKRNSPFLKALDE